jgi:hypothetical protein
MTVGGVDTYYDYDERQWKFRRLGGGPIHATDVCPGPQQTPETDLTNTASPSARQGRRSLTAADVGDS